MTKNRWEQFNFIIDNRDLKAKEKLLLIAIFRYYNEKKGYSYPSKATLKELCSFANDRDYYKELKSLEDKGFITKETIKGKGCKFYINFNSECQTDTHCQNDSDCQNDSNTHCQNDSNTHCQNDSTKRKSKSKTKENIYSDIFNFWNDKGIKKHRSLSIGIKQSINKALKEFTVEEIKQAISNYSTILHDETYYFSYVWGLDEFLVKKDKDRMKQLPQFLNEGSKWINYQNSKNKDNIIPFNNREFKRTPVSNNNDYYKNMSKEDYY